VQGALPTARPEDPALLRKKLDKPFAEAGREPESVWASVRPRLTKLWRPCSLSPSGPLYAASICARAVYRGGRSPTPVAALKKQISPSLSLLKKRRGAAALDRKNPAVRGALRENFIMFPRWPAAHAPGGFPMIGEPQGQTGLHRHLCGADPATHPLDTWRKAQICAARRRRGNPGRK